MASIIGMNIQKISAEKKENAIQRGIEIKTQPEIKDVKGTKLQGLTKDDIDILSVDFKMTSIFNPDAGNILIEGNILYKTDDKEEILKEWKTSKTLPSKDGVLILNHIFSKVSVIGLYLADILSLPPIVALPKVEPKKD